MVRSEPGRSPMVTHLNASRDGSSLVAPAVHRSILVKLTK